jgi:hypothetical protein
MMVIFVLMISLLSQPYTLVPVVYLFGLLLFLLAAQVLPDLQLLVYLIVLLGYLVLGYQFLI